MVNRYDTLVSVEVRTVNQPALYEIFGDLQQAYIWVKNFIRENPDNWSHLPEFIVFADDLDYEVYYSGVRNAFVGVSSPSSQIDVYYGKLVFS
jgi:hypothetical protein